MSKFARIFFSLAITLFGLSCAKVPPQPNPGADSPRTSFHLGDHHFPISTSVPAAQAAFDRGLTLSYAFNHSAAEKEFRRAAELDPQAAMPWWGVALVNGPHINYPLVPEEKAKVAWDALERARARQGNSSPLERDLIEALGSRYRAVQPLDRSGLDKDYAVAMEKVWLRHPANADVETLYAEALMDLHPWDLWGEGGVAKPWAPKILQVLERAIQHNPQHPGAHHLYIHAIEASSTPELGLPSADKLLTLVPGAGHLVHMPAHIYLRVGRWEDAAKSNQSAILADREFRKSNPHPGFYAVYMMHSNHFLSFVRMMQGQKEAALASAREMIAEVPAEFLKDFGPIADGYMAIEIEVLLRFGQWKEILEQPEPAAALPISRAMWAFARATAFTALDQTAKAQVAREGFLAAVKKVPADATFGNNNAHDLLKIARYVLDGEIAAHDKQYPAAIQSLNAALRVEDSLHYDEPPDWLLPVRHSLGIVLLNAGQLRDAERVYREDLERFPLNGWSLYGLSRALSLQGKNEEAAKVMVEFKREWARADTKIDASCLCQPGV